MLEPGIAEPFVPVEAFTAVMEPVMAIGDVSFESMEAREVLAADWFAAVDAPAGKGKAAALTG